MHQYKKLAYSTSAPITYTPKWIPAEPFCDTTEVSFNAFDHMVIRFEYTRPLNGMDLDIMIFYRDTGTIYDLDAVGYGQGPNTRKVPFDGIADKDAYLWWAADDTRSPDGPCVEAVVLGVSNIITGNPTIADNIYIDLRLGWYRIKGTGDVRISLVTYLGGIMTQQGTNILNVGGTQVDSKSKDVVVTSAPNQVTLLHSDLVGTIVYNKTTKKATLI